MLNEAQVLLAIVGLMAFWWAYHFCWQRALLNHFRQRLFATRDDLLMAAASGKISVDDPAYGMLRTMLNSLIYGSAHFTVPHSILFTMFRKVTRPSETNALPTLPEKIWGCIEQMNDEEQAALYRYFVQRMLADCTRYVLCWTPVLGVLFFAILASLPIALANRLFSSWPRRFGEEYVDSTVTLGGDAIWAHA